MIGVTDIDGQSTSVELPKVDHAEQFDRYRTTADEPSRYHEAGYNPWLQVRVVLEWILDLIGAG